MDIYPHKVDWAEFERACPISEDWEGPAEWLHRVEPDNWNESDMAHNVSAEAGMFMAKHLDRPLIVPLMNIIVGLGLDNIDWPAIKDDPNGEGESHPFVACLSPATVKRLLNEYDAVEQEALLASLQSHWPKLMALGRETWWAEDAQFWFPTAEEFLDYVNTWRDVYADAGKDARGIVMTCG